MTKSDKAKIEKIKELVKELNYHRDSYYNRNKPEIEDTVYDKIFDRLKELEEETGFILSDSPTQQVGYKVVSNLKKVKHSHPMLSLNKIHTIKELKEFIGNNVVVLSHKLDGLTICLTYDGGKLVRAETRGDGFEGEDVTHNASSFVNIPMTIPFKGYLEVEGEAIILKKDFDKINAELSEDEKYRHSRNLASGSVRLFDSEQAAKRKLRFIVWKVPEIVFTPEDNNSFPEDWCIPYFTSRFDGMKELGFDVVDYQVINPRAFLDFASTTEIQSLIMKELKQKAVEKGIPIDGLVCSYNDIEMGERLGVTSHHPKHSVAYKFEDDTVETIFRGCEWTLGKTGKITPTATFDSVEIDGTTVNRASVHNLDILKSLDLKVRDKITVYKANAIIPQIKKNLTSEERQSTHPDYTLLEARDIPTICPCCHQPTKVVGCDLMCINPMCEGKLLSKLTHFVSKDCFNIEGLSEATLDKFIKMGWLKSFSDIFTLWNHYYEIIDLDGFGKKSADKLFDNIENAKEIELDRFLNAICINGVGKTQAKAIADYCDGEFYDFLMYYREPDRFAFYVVEGIGETVNNNIYNRIDEMVKTGEIDILHHIQFKEPKPIAKSEKLKGKTFVITGKLNTYKNRDEAIAHIQEHGGKVSGSVSAKTDYLVNNDINSNSGKNKKAKALGIPIITEEELILKIVE